MRNDGKQQVGWIFDTVGGLNAKLKDEADNFTDIGDDSLVRELIQNSGDNPSKENGHVRMKVSVGTIDRDSAYSGLRLDELESHIRGTIELAQERAGAGNDPQIITKCNNQLEFLKAGNFSYLRFSDYGTTGIQGVEDEKRSAGKGAFWNLLFNLGVSNKLGTGSAGGAGVGRLTFYRYSAIYTVLFNTRSSQGCGMGGSAFLVQSKSEGQNYTGQGEFVAYQGDKDHIIHGNGGERDIEPISFETAQGILPGVFNRSELGTDVVIFGLNENLGQDWEEWFALYAIRNFYVSFLRGADDLEIECESKGEERVIQIDQDSCRDVLSKLDFKEEDAKYRKVQNEAIAFMDAYQNGDGDSDDYKIYEINDFKDTLGPLKLYLSKSDSAKKVGCSKWEIVRSFGMTTVCTSVETDIPVIGVLEVTSNKGSNFLKKMEQASHVSYDKTLKSKKPEIGKLERKVKELMQLFGQRPAGDELAEVEALGDYISYEDPEKAAKRRDLEGSKATIKPMISVRDDAPKTVKRKKRNKSRVRTDDVDSEKNPGDEIGLGGHEGTGHIVNPGPNPAPLPNADAPYKPALAYWKTHEVSSSFGVVAKPDGKTAEVVGILGSAKFSKVDVKILAVGEEGYENYFLPAIERAELFDGRRLQIEKGYIVKDVPVDTNRNQGKIALKVTFAAPFRSALSIHSIAKIPSKEESKDRQAMSGRTAQDESRNKEVNE